MAMNLTNQVRSIAEVTKAVAGGDLTKKIEVDVRGEMLELKETVNGMTESLSVFADEVTRYAYPACHFSAIVLTEMGDLEWPEKSVLKVVWVDKPE